jgi:hypothetical protein
MCMAECAGCIRLQGEVNDVKTKCSNLETECSNLETECSNLKTKFTNLQTELNTLKEKDEKLTVREICLTLEQHICAEAIGRNRARLDDISRFHHLQGSDLQRVNTVLVRLGLTIGVLYKIRKLGSTVAHEDREPITVPTLRSLINNPSDYKEMIEKKQKFIDALYCYNMVDDKEQVQTFFDEAVLL